MKYQVNIKELKEWVSASWLESRINSGEQTPEDTDFFENIVNAMLYGVINISKSQKTNLKHCGDLHNADC
ncbi:hypothetical protein 65p337 [Aeromonas phage 65]|uniref:Uncharacterized protein n=1 Tax=Aeromonas phage 65 TaxID=2919549 RepID=E5DSH1_9CAUD|nr:hypothetical protein ST65p337 [Aeromonas phage 65]ADQ53345.1 hypothetical protein 65p337 [Aeromonas phage 65]